MGRSLPILDGGVPLEGLADPSQARRKLGLLRRQLEPLLPGGVLVAFSGGVDSALLVWVAHDLASRKGGRVVALTTTSASTPEGDRADAEAFTGSLGVPHLWRESGEVGNPEYSRNDRDRCYHCKVELFRIGEAVAKEEGLKWLLYGYNASDRGDDRPGHRAATEAGALSPLAQAGLTKSEIRLLMRDAGLSLAGKPASPCLSSRIMTGIPVTPERLRDVEAMEEILRRAGIETLRVRVCEAQGGDPFLRVEVGPGDMERVMACREELNEAGTDRGYRWVTLDLGGYRTGGGVS